jgi:hypothetical protein
MMLIEAILRAGGSPRMTLPAKPGITHFGYWHTKDFPCRLADPRDFTARTMEGGKLFHL